MAKSHHSAALSRINMRSTGLKHLAFALVLSGCAGAAMAQYVWLDAKGVKQYSDMPPPASVPNSKILKSPGSASQPAAPSESTTASNDENGTEKTPKAPPSLADKNADFQKRRAEQAEKDKLAADKTRQEADKKKNCERAGNYQRALGSGQRITRMTPSGERAYMTDDERAAEVRENQRNMADCK
jgi:hypothetical protein